jgi:hypothetical protein
MWKANGKTTTLLLFLDSLFPKIEEMCKGSSGLHSLENTVWKRLWICHKTDYYLTGK